MTDPADLIAGAARACPGLALQDPTITLPEGQGQYSTVLIVNDALVLRFPRFEEGAAAMRQETEILRALRGMLPLPIPDPLYSGDDPVFMGYPLLPGAPLWRERAARIDAERQRRIAAQLGRFLTALHAVPRDRLPAGLPVQDRRDEWSQQYAAVRNMLFPAMRPEARAHVRTHYETFLDTQALHRFTPALRHGDFGGSNILYDEHTGTVTAVIDFGFAGLGDPAIDLAAVSTFGDSFLAAVLAVYPADESALARARFYRGTYALQEALYGVRSGDREAYEAGMAAYV